jgi:hypothetical protein
MPARAACSRAASGPLFHRKKDSLLAISQPVKRKRPPAAGSGWPSSTRYRKCGDASIPDRAWSRPVVGSPYDLPMPAASLT